MVVLSFGIRISDHEGMQPDQTLHIMVQQVKL